MTDPISDMLIRIKNALAVGKKTVEIPNSKLKFELAQIFKKSGYISSVERKGKKARKFIELGLLYNEEGRPRISGLRRVSKPSRRIYRPVRDIRKVKQGLGTAIVSTPQGLKTDAEAKKERLGGEVLCEIW